jgi:hypothetical protein
MRPQRSVAIEPLVKLRKRLRAQGVDPELSLLVHLDKSGVAEDPQVSGGARTSDWQQRCQLTSRGGTLAQGIQDGSPARVRERLQDGVHRIFVTYWVRTCQVTHSGRESPPRLNHTE